ncbi:hypothetical protein [Leptolyngbya sp. FACHB-321]|uniref:hypothetical protein n=1 Tax=Leptolyngbya sp. FACHB-321 TaxID=2692807 RepID=UPI001A7EE39E|nr:hypothetical protein [Leptolyngbya sp. FACHB-321]
MFPRFSVRVLHSVKVNQQDHFCPRSKATKEVGRSLVLQGITLGVTGFARRVE